MSAWLDAAVRDNARWCDLVCRTRGLVTVDSERLWSCPTRTPPLYPDAVTVRPEVGAEEILAAIDTAPGCSIKDSYADVELGSFGFQVLFRATWLVHRQSIGGASPARHGWAIITGEAEFGLWEQAWRADGPRGVLLPALLEAPNVNVFARIVDGQLLGGCILHHAHGAIGLSNVFALEHPTHIWAELLEVVRSRWPERPIVCYERGSSLQLAFDLGFEQIGGLRVWVRGE